MRSPLIWVAFFLSLGIWVSSVIQIPVLFIVSAALSFLIASLFTLRRKIAPILCLSVAFLFIGCLVFQAKQIFPADHIKNFTPENPEEVCIKGVVIDEPVSSRTFYGGEKINFTLKAENLQRQGIDYGITGKIKVSSVGEYGIKAPSYGDRLLIKGKLSKPRGPQNPGEFNYAGYLARNRILSALSARARDILTMEGGQGNAVVGIAYKTRGAIEKFISANLPEESANFLNAILLGLRQGMDNRLNDAFMRTGTVHLIAISGLNVGLIAFLVLLLLRIVRVPNRAGFALTIVFLVFYAVLTGGTPSVTRATVMSIALLFGLLIKREASLWNSLGLAALIILSCDPAALFDIGFQLSFVSVISLLYITPKIEKFFHYERKIAFRFLSGWRRYLLEGLFISLAAWLGVLPLILYYFNIVTPVSIIANLVAVPLSFLITAASAPFLIFGFFLPPAAKIFGASTSFLCEALFTSNGFFSKVPFAYIYLPKPPLFLIVLYYLFLAMFLGHERLKLSVAKISVGALIIINAVIWTGALRPSDGRLKVTFLDVGHGDSVFLEFPHGGNMLIDAGTGGGEEWDSGRSTVLPFLRQKGIQVLDAVVLTHPDIDHVGGLASVLDGLKVRYIFDNGASSDTYAYRRFRRAISDNKIAAGNRFVLRRGDSISGIKDIRILCLNPALDWATDPDIPANDISLVLRMSFGDSAMLFCGDAGERAVSYMMFSLRRLLRADLVMLPHHGEKLGPAGEDFIDCVQPDYAVISQGRAAGEISRSEDMKVILSAKGIEVLRTNVSGAVFAVTDGKSLYVDHFKSIPRQATQNPFEVFRGGPSGKYCRNP